MLDFVHVSDTERASASSNLDSVDRPRNVLRRPNHLIVVPVRAWVKVWQVLTIHLLITVDEVREEGISFDGRYNLDVDLLPLVVPPWLIEALPVEEERSDCALLGRALDPGPKLAIPEWLMRPYGPTHICLRDTGHAQESDGEAFLCPDCVHASFLISKSMLTASENGAYLYAWPPETD